MLAVEELILSDELFMGMGGQQKTFIHPTDPSKCVIIAYAYNGVNRDLKKELRYRKVCADSLKNSRLITKYFGEVSTNLGTGYVYERVRDFNGNTSQDLSKFLENMSNDAESLKIVETLLLGFKEDFLRECIVTGDKTTTNFMVQETAPGVYQVRIVDNIGTPVWIPLVYYFKFVAEWRARRLWNIWADELIKNFPQLVLPELVEKLRA